MAVTRNDLDEFDNDDRDDLDEFIAECDRRDPGFAALVEKKLRERLAARARGEDRDESAPAESTVASTE